MSYFVMVGEGTYPVAPIQTKPSTGEFWWTGSMITRDVEQPLIYGLNPSFPGTPKPMYDEQVIPIVRDDVITAWKSAGIDNVQYFGAILRDPTSGAEYTNYKAFNIIGIVECADMEKSELMGTSDSEMTDVDFHSLVIDETKTHGLLMFRLAENASAIVVHQKIKAAVEAAGIEGMMFYEPGDWAG